MVFETYRPESDPGQPQKMSLIMSLLCDMTNMSLGITGMVSFGQTLLILYRNSRTQVGQL